MFNAKPIGADADIRMRQTSNTLPTAFNGGVRTWREHVRRWGYFGMLVPRLLALRQWEKRFSVVEREIQRAALTAALGLSLKDIGPDETLAIARYGAPKTVFDNDLKNLPASINTRFRLYFHEISHEATRQVMAQALVTQEAVEGTVDQVLNLDDDALKRVASEGTDAAAVLSRMESVIDTIPNVVQSIASGSSADRIRDRVNARMSSDSEAQDALKRYEKFMQYVSSLDPRVNRQVSRVQKATNATSSPKALARITRGTISSVVIDKPMEYVFLLTCFAAATTGIYAVIQPEMHSNTSSYWLSTYLFGTSFMVGVITDVLAGPWLRAQTFSMHSEQAFNDVPTGEDKNLSFFGWWLKKVRSPGNSWWENQKNYYSIITANLKAAFVLAAATNFLTIGRFDIDMYLLGYFSCYILPLAGMSSQYENAFELASGGYDARNVPPELRAHPDLQSYALEMGQKRRTIYSFWSKVFENLTGNLSSQWIGMTSPTYGSRGLGRILFGGYTPTELAALATRAVEGWASAVPVAGPYLAAGVRACESLFTNNYEAWTRVPGR